MGLAGQDELHGLLVYVYCVSHRFEHDLTGLWLGYCFGSLTWSAGNLMGLLSKVDKKLFAKVTSDMIVRWKPPYNVSPSVK